MNKFPSILFNILSIILIVVFIILATMPFEFFDMEQAQRIAKWKLQFEKLNYYFSLVDTNEGSIVNEINFDEDTQNRIMLSRVKPYLNIDEKNYLSIHKNYKYKKKNGGKLNQQSQFNFKEFVECKDGTLISFKKNDYYQMGENQPIYYMYVDINGEEKPNKIGEDIFFIDIFEHEIKALGYDKEYNKLKKNCSPISSGLYCSEFYLLGGHF